MLHFSYILLSYLSSKNLTYSIVIETKRDSLSHSLTPNTTSLQTLFLVGINPRVTISSISLWYVNWAILCMYHWYAETTCLFCLKCFKAKFISRRNWVYAVCTRTYDISLALLVGVAYTIWGVLCGAGWWVYWATLSFRVNQCSGLRVG